MSKFGVALCVLYVSASALCIWAGLSAGELKGAFVLLQLPLALQAAFLHWVGAGGFLSSLSWPAAYVALGVPTLAALYGAGAVTGNVLAKLVRRVRWHAP